MQQRFQINHGGNIQRAWTESRSIGTNNQPAEIFFVRISGPEKARRQNLSGTRVTGSISRIVVLDIDFQHGGDASVERLEQQHGYMPVTVECRSGGGGRHLYFAHPGDLVRNKVGLAAGVDLRGDGGYVVAPPSMHTSGARYAWREDRRPEDTNLATLPDWLLRRAIGEVGRLGRPISYWRRLVREGVSEGDRNNTVASLAGDLLESIRRLHARHDQRRADRA